MDVPEVLKTGFGLFIGILFLAFLFHEWTEISFWLIHLLKRLFWKLRRCVKRRRKAPGC